MLIDRFMPEWDEHTTHSRRIAAPAEDVWRELWRIDLSRIGVVRILLGLRGLPARLAGGSTTEIPDESTPTLVAIQSAGFGKLAEEPPREVVFGVTGRFWRPGGNIDPFVRGDHDRPVAEGRARAVWNFSLEPAGDATTVRTETRIACGDRASRRRFRAYWLVVRPFSSLIRTLMLRALDRRCAAG